ncbi:FkbM family methyltransferase [Flavobacterium sp.]|uniref:FkbM family methyltransferase n=1 Tax=Flavobacterium sp. TaxID=239 RepID=UPI0025EA7423|nr:FkbM family methyltransferase [Flavobacterium sp.]
MQKLFQLHRLDAANKKRVLQYLWKRIIQVKPTIEERIANEYYAHLIRYQGILQSESETFFVSHYPKLGVTLKTRKRPSSDLDVFSQIYKYSEYEPLVTLFKKNFPNTQAPNIIDAGSNIGLTTVYLSKYFSDAQFLAIEPDSSNFEVMLSNFDLNQVSVKTIKGGIWSQNTFLKIISDFRDKNHWSIRVEETNDASELPAFSLHYLVDTYQLNQIDILKIDIEGSEKEVFTGIAADVSYLAKTKCIAIEIHDEFDCRQAIYSILDHYNFRYIESGELTIGINQSLL